MVPQHQRSALCGSTEQAGFTLVELMVGMIIASVIVAAGFTILTTTNKSLQANEQVVDMQQNVRMAMEMLTRYIKSAGFGSPGVAIG
ncbi:MAG TPA: prepilin-type N-terminal cleavage/methylation domain-containing protein, partial [Nitrospiraceae bacterium]|nr:prepilin-type N-terminal cleavage/methylation domain-containing protein [Nitrospiraceae bacterium]